jgi:hypothetical protein
MAVVAMASTYRTILFTDPAGQYVYVESNSSTVNISHHYIQRVSPEVQWCDGILLSLTRPQWDILREAVERKA